MLIFEPGSFIDGSSSSRFLFLSSRFTSPSSCSARGSMRGCLEGTGGSGLRGRFLLSSLPREGWKG